MFMPALLYIFSFNRNITLACSNRLSGFQSSGSSVSEVKSSLSPPWYSILIGSFSFLNIIAISKTHRKSFQTYLTYINSKGVSLVACTLVRYAKRTAGRWSSQSVWVSLTTFSSVICRVWLNLSVNPLVCGWYAEDTLCSVPVRRNSSSFTWFTNSRPWSEMTISQHPNLEWKLP